MPWRETSPVNERKHFIDAHQRGELSVSELCWRFGISRKTGYKWLERFEGGRQAMGDRSRAPHHCPHRISDEMARLICDARRQHPSWGPEKLLQWLAPRHPALVLPAISTAGKTWIALLYVSTVSL